MNKELQAAFDTFNWDEYFAALDANPQGNIHAFCDHASGYCATTANNCYEGSTA